MLVLLENLSHLIFNWELRRVASLRRTALQTCSIAPPAMDAEHWKTRAHQEKQLSYSD